MLLIIINGEWGKNFFLIFQFTQNNAQKFVSEDHSQLTISCDLSRISASWTRTKSKRQDQEHPHQGLPPWSGGGAYAPMTRMIF